MAKVTKKVTKKRIKKNVERGQAHIQASFNNTIVTLTDAEGNALSLIHIYEIRLKSFSSFLVQLFIINKEVTACHV